MKDIRSPFLKKADVIRFCQRDDSVPDLLEAQKLSQSSKGIIKGLHSE